MKELQQQFEHELLKCRTADDVEVLRLKYLGRKGAVQAQMKQLKDLQADEKADFGARINKLKNYGGFLLSNNNIFSCFSNFFKNLIKFNS